MSDALRKAAQDVIDRWHSPKWAHDSVHTGVLIDRLRAALAQPDDAKQRLLEIMRKNGLATGHGDTLKQVIDTLEVELTDVLSAARQNAARYRWLRDNTELDELDELVFEIDKPDWDSAIDESIKEHHGINELRKAAQTLESYCLGYTHSKCETCQQQANWLALNQFPNELFQAMKFSAQRISDDGCRLTNMGAYVPMGEQP